VRFWVGAVLWAGVQHKSGQNRFPALALRCAGAHARTVGGSPGAAQTRLSAWPVREAALRDLQVFAGISQRAVPRFARQVGADGAASVVYEPAGIGVVRWNGSGGAVSCTLFAALSRWLTHPKPCLQVRHLSSSASAPAGTTQAQALNINAALGMDLTFSRPNRSAPSAAEERKTAKANLDASALAAMDLSFSVPVNADAVAAQSRDAAQLVDMAESVLRSASSNWELEFTMQACEQKKAQDRAQGSSSASAKDFAMALLLARGASFSN